jgi:hypothetical protein
VRLPGLAFGVRKPRIPNLNGLCQKRTPLALCGAKEIVNSWNQSLKKSVSRRPGVLTFLEPGRQKSNMGGNVVSEIAINAKPCVCTEIAGDIIERGSSYTKAYIHVA